MKGIKLNLLCVIFKKRKTKIIEVKLIQKYDFKSNAAYNNKYY